MKPNNKLQISQREKKERIPVWLYPSTLEAIDKAMGQADSKSRSEFLENAARFYSGYIAAGSAIQYLPHMLVSAFRAIVQNSESHICRLLFKLAMETDMTMNILAAGMEIPEGQLRELRGRCVQNVKKTNGGITLENAVAYQNGEDGR